MAHSKRRRKAVARRNPAGRRRRKYTTRRRSTHRRRNPGALGSAGSWVVGGAGILGGVVVTRALPQLVLGSSNSGPMGYAANAATAVLGGFLLNSIGAGRKFAVPFVGGGFAALIARIISDYTPYGKALALSGWGDYQFSNIVGTVPQRVINMNSAVTEWGGPGNANLAMSRGGSDFGVRGGSC